MPPIKTEPGVRIKSEHDTQEHDIKREDRVRQEDPKPDIPSSTHDRQSRGRRRSRFRHSKNYMVHKLRGGETIRAQYRRGKWEDTVVFTMGSRAADILKDSPAEADRAEEKMFERLRKAHFNIQPIDPSGILYRRMAHARESYKNGVWQTVVEVDVEYMSDHSESEDWFDSEEECPWVYRSPRTGRLYARGEHGESPPYSESSSVNLPPATHPRPISSMSSEPSKGISATSRPEEKPKTQVSQVAPRKSSSTTAFKLLVCPLIIRPAFSQQASRHNHRFRR